MNTNPIKKRLPYGFWVIATVALFIASLFLFTERFFWKLHSEMGATSEGRYAAFYDIQGERFQYLILDPNGHFNFTGELRDGIEIWNHGYAVQFLFTTPRRLPAKSYVSAYNGVMRRYLRRLDVPPSAVQHRSAELRHEDYKVRERAAKFLGMMGPQARDAVPPLIVATQDDYAEVNKIEHDSA